MNHSVARPGAYWASAGETSFVTVLRMVHFTSGTVWPLERTRATALPPSLPLGNLANWAWISSGCSRRFSYHSMIDRNPGSGSAIHQVLESFHIPDGRMEATSL